jgi:hypothetical protein
VFVFGKTVSFITEESRKGDSVEIDYKRLTDTVLEDIWAERERQNQKWGIQRHEMGTWLSILGEEYGEVCQAVQGYLNLVSFKEGSDKGDPYTECIHVAAVAGAMAEQILEERQKLKG